MGRSAVRASLLTVSHAAGAEARARGGGAGYVDAASPPPTWIE